MWNWLKWFFGPREIVYNVNVSVKFENGPPTIGRHSETTPSSPAPSRPVDSRGQTGAVETVSADLFADADAPEVDFGQEVS